MFINYVEWMCNNNSNFHMGGFCISPGVSNINLHKSWNPFTFAPEALADHVCTSLWPSTGDWGLLICLAHLTPRTGEPKTRLCGRGAILYKNRHNLYRKDSLILNTLRHSAMCHIVHLRAMTQLGWGNSLGTKQRSNRHGGNWTVQHSQHCNCMYIVQIRELQS